MNISLNWIKNYVETAGISDQEIADILTLTGLEVEEMEVTGTDFENFVVGEVLEVRAHPNADKLQVCRVDQGRSEEHTSELQSRGHLVCRLLLEKKNN